MNFGFFVVRSALSPVDLAVGRSRRSRWSARSAARTNDLDVDKVDLGFPRNRGGFLYAASGWMAAIFSYSTGGSNPAELWRRRVL